MQHSDVGVGRRTDLNVELTALGMNCLTAGRVLAQYTQRWLVATPGEQLHVRLVPARGRLRRATEGPPVTGDWVALDANDAIVAVLERRGAIVRRAAGPVSDPQVLAANVDLALIVEPLPDPNPGRIERFVALAAAAIVGLLCAFGKSPDWTPADRRAWGRTLLSSALSFMFVTALLVASIRGSARSPELIVLLLPQSFPIALPLADKITDNGLDGLQPARLFTVLLRVVQCLH